MPTYYTHPRPESGPERGDLKLEPDVERWLFSGGKSAVECLGSTELKRLTASIAKGELPEEYSDVEALNISIRDIRKRCRQEQRAKKKK